MNRTTIAGWTAALALVTASPALHAQAPATIDPRIAELLDAVSEDRLRANVEGLASFQTRSTLSSVDRPDFGIGAARQWILDEMRNYSPRLQVSFDTYVAPAGGRIPEPTELRNVMAVLPGRSDRRIYVSGHYDTVARAEEQLTSGNRFDNPAPGANDDGSGTALTMELARVFAQSGIEFDATLVFIALAGEEQGLVGAALHAQQARENDVRIDAVFNNDIVGNIHGGNGAVDGWTIRVFSEGPEDSYSRQLARFIRRTGALYMPSHRVRLIAREDRFGRGGDHTPFHQLGFAAVRFTESKENYDRQHTVRDTPDGVHAPYLARNARVNAAGVATLALAPPAPVVMAGGSNPMLTRQPSGYDARLRWEASPGAAGYRIFWREAWGVDWEHELYVGDVTEFVLRDISIDDYIFGVAAVGPNGHESLVSAYVRPPRAPVRIEPVR
ncbi:MAG TPA: M20/M25/M40 family metallo-hydrolase [Longimicrobiales bacterium]|nr:M20/M25/M40 family metallo-hydrolase [Longimicrobiales bacterium]